MASDTCSLTADCDTDVGLAEDVVEADKIPQQPTRARRFLGVYALTRPRGWTDDQLDVLQRKQANDWEASRSPSLSTSTASTTGLVFEDSPSQTPSVSPLDASGLRRSLDALSEAIASGDDKLDISVTAVSVPANDSMKARNPLFAAFQSATATGSHKRKRQRSQTLADSSLAVSATPTEPRESIADDVGYWPHEGGSETTSEVDYRDAAHHQVKIELQRIKRQLRMEHRRSLLQTQDRTVVCKHTNSTIVALQQHSPQSQLVKLADSAAVILAYDRDKLLLSASQRPPPAKIDLSSNESRSVFNIITPSDECAQSPKPNARDASAAAVNRSVAPVQRRRLPPYTASVKLAMRAAPPSRTCHSCAYLDAGLLTCILCHKRLCFQCLQESYSAVASYSAIFAFATTLSASCLLSTEVSVKGTQIKDQLFQSRGPDMSALDFACPQCKGICKCVSCSANAASGRTTRATTAGVKSPRLCRVTKISRLAREAAIFSGYNAPSDRSVYQDGRRRRARGIDKPARLDCNIRTNQRPKVSTQSSTEERHPLSQVTHVSSSRPTASASRRRFRAGLSSPSCRHNDPLAAAEARRRAIDEETEHTPHVAARLPVTSLQPYGHTIGHNPRANAVPRLGSPPYELDTDDSIIGLSRSEAQFAMLSDVERRDYFDCQHPQFSMPDSPPTRVLLDVQMGAKLGSRRLDGTAKAFGLASASSAGELPYDQEVSSNHAQSMQTNSSDLHSHDGSPHDAACRDHQCSFPEQAPSKDNQQDVISDFPTFVHRFSEADIAINSTPTGDKDHDAANSVHPNTMSASDEVDMFEYWTSGDLIDNNDPLHLQPIPSKTDIKDNLSLAVESNANVAGWTSHDVRDPLLATDVFSNETSLMSIARLDDNDPLFQLL